MKVYAIEMPFEGIQRLYSTREGAEAALMDEDEYPAVYQCYVREVEVY